MSIWTALYTGTSGLVAHGEAINVVGDNIANTSTVGFKESRASFGDIIGETPVAGGQPVGDGVRAGPIETLFGQGTLQNTGNVLDMGIQGNGFFSVAGVYHGLAGNWYSRDGRFHLDSSHNVVNADGLKLQGYLIDPTGKLSSAPGDLQLNAESPPNATTTAQLHVNLSTADAAPAAWNPATPAATSNWSTSETVYDSIGQAHTVNVYFRNTGANGAWEWHAMVDGGDLTGGVKGTQTQIADGTLTFTNTGALQATTTNSSSANFNNAVQNQVINFDFGSQIANGGTGLDSTSYAKPDTVSLAAQDGYGAGTLTTISIDQKGVISGQFSNGKSRQIAQVALATFQAQSGLARAGDQLFAATKASGDPLTSTPGSGDRGSISSGSLESSNVDLSTQLVTLIAYQRAFEANSKTVQTSDQMLQEVNGLKR